MATNFIPLSSDFASLKISAPPPIEPSPNAEHSNEEDNYRLHRRFDRMGRLIGDHGMQTLFTSHAMVIGLGGVGSWAAESLVRSGVGRMTLVDFDLICVTNTNRQLHAMRGSTGKPKVEVMGQRLQAINPRCQVICERRFYNAESSDNILSLKPDLVIDAIDNLNAKAHLIATCSAQGIPLIASGGASGRLDPTQIREADMTEVQGDAFIAAVRKLLRRNYSFGHDGAWDIPTIYSLEPILEPIELAYDQGQGFVCVCPQGNNGLHSCDRRNVIYGTASFVTGSFGLACAAAAVRTLLAAHTAQIKPALETT